MLVENFDGYSNCVYTNFTEGIKAICYIEKSIIALKIWSHSSDGLKKLYLCCCKSLAMK